jgi:hypothetical protein
MNTWGWQISLAAGATADVDYCFFRGSDPAKGAITGGAPAVLGPNCWEDLYINLEKRTHDDLRAMFLVQEEYDGTDTMQMRAGSRTYAVAFPDNAATERYTERYTTDKRGRPRGDAENVDLGYHHNTFRMAYFG